MTELTELEHKLARLRALLAARGAKAILLTRAENLAWLSGGGDVLINREGPPIAEALVTPEVVAVLSNQIEAERLRDEELPSGLELAVYDWFEPAQRARRIRELTGGAEALSDNDIDLMDVRNPLLPVEVTRYRAVGKAASEGMTEVATGLTPELSERRVAARLHGALRERGLQVPVVLVAGQARFGRYRHPVPQDVPFGSVGLLVVCAQQRGLVVSLSRMVAFGAVPEVNRERLACVQQVEAAMLDATRPGATLAEVFRAAQRAYAEVGFPEAWREHHQGGPTGYQTRDVLATPHEGRAVQAGVAYAWNPSLPHAKAEDTFLCSDRGLENLTFDARWPAVTVAGRARAACLVL